MSIIPPYDIEEINLGDYNSETKKIILSNLKNYTKLEIFKCHNHNLTELPDLPDTLIELYCYNNNLTYFNLQIKTINETNFKNKIIKRMKLLNRNLLLEHSAMITMNPKRIQRLLDNLEINFFDGSFDTLTY